MMLLALFVRAAVLTDIALRGTHKGKLTVITVWIKDLPDGPVAWVFAGHERACFFQGAMDI